MKNIVLTIHHKHDDEFIVCDLKKYELIKKELIAYPTPISVDLYEDGELVQVEAICGSIEFLLGFTTTKLRGTFVQRLETLGI